MTRVGAAGSPQSTFAPDAFTTADHLSVSALMYRANSSRLIGIGCAPWFASCAIDSFSPRIDTTSLFHQLSTGTGVRAGARRPIQFSASYLGRPDSATVGTSGSVGQRLRLVTAIA